MSLRYPAPPSRVPDGITQPAPSFQHNIRKVVVAIGLFVAVYLLMFVLAVALTAACISGGLSLMAIYPSIWTLLIGGGMMFMGVMVLFFLLKFVFARSGDNGPEGVELTEADEPELFAFIRKVASDVGTQFPNKIFLIPDVNASVFYHSSFWSLFFPTRKNLNIGLGLANSVNVSEFKSVLAHEFGHFSQDSMRLGSYVYFVNQAIHNMLYQNTGWAGAVSQIANLHTILALFAQVAVWIVQGIQWVLQQMYGFINRQYLGLSREMEFHADTIAASVSGSNNMIQALRQIILGSQTYQHTIEKCNELLRQNSAPANFYSSQQAVSAFVAKQNDLPVQHGLPQVSPSFVEQQRRSRVVFTNQWASHPTETEREDNLNRLGLQAEVVDAPAWSLFRQPEHWQRELTGFLYREVESSAERKILDAREFETQYAAEQAKNQLPKVFNGWYDEHYLAEVDLDALQRETRATPFAREAFDALFGQKISTELAFVQGDIDTLQAIADGQIDTKTFDFDGQKYPRAQAGEIKAKLEAELADLQAEQERRDRESVRFFYAAALTQDAATAERLLDAYRDLYVLMRLKKQFDQPAREVLITVHYLGLTEFEKPEGELAEYFAKLRTKNAPVLHEVFGQLEGAEWFTPEMKKQLAALPDSTVAYAHEQGPHRTNLQNLVDLIGLVGPALDTALFQRLKVVTEIQAGLITAE